MSIDSRVTHPNLEYYKKQAKALLSAAESGDEVALTRLRRHRPNVDQISNADQVALTNAQFAIAREEGFPSWPKFKAYIDERSMDFRQKVEAFIHGATLGDPRRAVDLLQNEPSIASANLHTALVLGDAGAVDALIGDGDVNSEGGPNGWPALLYVCFSRLTQVDATLASTLADTGRMLLERGADPRCGFWTKGERPEFESAIYGATSVSRNAALTAMLIERGADPNDDEAVYHAPETRDLGAMKVLVESGKPNPESLATMLLRKLDWHDLDGVRYLIDHGADPNHPGRWGQTPIHKAIERDNSLEILELLLERGSDSNAVCQDLTAFSRAARRGRVDFLDLCERRELAVELVGVDELIADCVRGRSPSADAAHVREIVEMGGTLIAQFAGNGNTAGVGCLLDLGVDIDARYCGDGYFGIAKDSTALHVAAWRARHETVKYLIGRGAPVDAVDAAGQTPLMLAVRACVDSYWSDQRSPESVEALLTAGASVERITLPTGYDAVDALLESRS